MRVTSQFAPLLYSASDSSPSGELDRMSSAERISFLQEKLQEIRKYYLSLKSEVASIDRRRKRLKKKEREGEEAGASAVLTPRGAH